MPNLGDTIALADLVECIDKTFSLPDVQRGFVWKPHQIENLWDSLLRGYPVGSFVLTPNRISPFNYLLLDGQQRATAICLGFHNKSFKIPPEQIMIFIDLAKPDSNQDNRKYLFRVITRSHPWGYQRRENQKTLESKHIKQALDAYAIKGYDYLGKPLRDFWPYDAYHPVPLGLFLNGSDINSVEESIKAWQKGKSLTVIGKKEIEKEHYSIAEIFGDVRQMLEHQKIPLMFLDIEKMNKDETNPNVPKDKLYSSDSKTTYQSTVTDDSVDEIENLFIRLNSGGTPLSGEELNYSVLKAHIESKIQRRIEDKCIGLFTPPRFITIAYRLYSVSGRSINTSESLRMRIKPKQFQRTMRSDKVAFIQFLSEHFLEGDLIEKVRKLLCFHKEDNPIGMPLLLCRSLSEKAPEIMFMLIYRILNKNDIINEQIKPSVLGIITLFFWLGRGQSQKDHRRLLKTIWPCVTHFDTKRFWSSETVQRAMINDDYELLTPFPRINDLKKIIPDGKKDIRNFVVKNIYKKALFYGEFIRKIFFNKDLILYTQRAQLAEWFSEIEGYHFVDTNRAFDWDHICPHSYVFNKKNIPLALKNWYGSIGNFRAWPYAWNRSDGDSPPSEKLNPVSDDEINWWRNALKKPELKRTELKKYLLRASVCDTEWLDLNSETSEKIKQTQHAKKVIRCILNRNIQICTEWYKQLHIEPLLPAIPKKKKDLFDSFFNMKLWKKEDEEDDYLPYNFSIKKLDIKLYFSFYTGGHTITEDCIYFAILSENQELGKIQIPEKIDQHFIREDENEIGKYFTLRSYSEQSKIDLFKELNSWLQIFPDKNIQKPTLEAFQRSIKKKCRNRIFE